MGGTSAPDSAIRGDDREVHRAVGLRRSQLVPVHLQTRRDGDPGWTDRGLAYVPEPVVDRDTHTLSYDAITYVIEDVTYDGPIPTLRARTRRPRTSESHSL